MMIIMTIMNLVIVKLVIIRIATTNKTIDNNDKS